MSTPPPSTGVPHSRGVILATCHSGTLELFGARGLRAVADRIPEDARIATIDEPPLTLAWYPTAHLVAWWEAVLTGAAEGDAARFREFLDRTTDLGFGRIRRTLLGFAGPEGLVARAAELWRHDHTHGSLVVVESGPSMAKVALRDHPFLGSAIARDSITEIIRHILSLARGVKRVRCSHSAAGGALGMQFDWE